jgi:hypothetical protein
VSAQAQELVTENVLATTEPVVQQALRREVNDKIMGGSALTGSGASSLLCECVHPNCTGRVLMTSLEYEEVRRFPTRFVVKASHEVAEDERVVADSDGYVVVEKSGPSGLYAVSADPRRRVRGQVR